MGILRIFFDASSAFFMAMASSVSNDWRCCASRRSCTFWKCFALSATR